MLIDELQSRGLIHPPKWLAANTIGLFQMGSAAYGASSNDSDIDVYGIAIPPREDAFPHLRGEILDFGRQKQRFAQWQEHHVKVPDWGKEYDFSVFSIIKYFNLCMENNPNCVDSLFVPRRCVMHSTAIYEMIRENRRTFLHKGSWHRYRGYAYSQMHKIDLKTNAQNPKRAESIATHGYDLKFSYHCVRLLEYAEQILTEHDLDIERNREQLKSIRRGEWTLQQIRDHFVSKERHLEEVYAKSTLRHSPDEPKIKQLLIDCLEHHYGDLSKAIARDVSAETILRDFQDVIDRYKAPSC